MNRDSIIQHLTKVSYIKDTCRIAGHLSDDLFQHIWVKILELDYCKLEQIYSKGYLQFYIYRMIVNEARNKNNPFLKNNTIVEYLIEDRRLVRQSKYSKTNEYGLNEWSSEIDRFTDDVEKYNIENDKQFEIKLEKVKSTLDKLFWYDKKIFELYLEHGSLRKVAKETKIGYGAIHQTVTKVKKQLNENIISRSL